MQLSLNIPPETETQHNNNNQTEKVIHISNIYIHIYISS